MEGDEEMPEFGDKQSWRIYKFLKITKTLTKSNWCVAQVIDTMLYAISDVLSRDAWHNVVDAVIESLIFHYQHSL